MNLKKFNKETQTWDIIASGNASGIAVTDPHFVSEGDVQKSVNDVLVEMDNKIEQTRRNLSWVVLNGTIGGGGGGASTDAELIISHPNLAVVNGTNTIYATSERVVLGCLVKQTRSNQKYYVSLILDNQEIINRHLVLSNRNDELEIPNVAAFSEHSSHSVTITCEDENGIALEPVFITITESSIKLAVDKTMYNALISEAAPIRYHITNKVLYADTSLFFKNETIGFENSISVGQFTQSSPMAVDVDFFKSMFPESYQHIAGTSYKIISYAQTIVSGQPINSNEVEVQVVVQDSETLVVLTSGITDITNKDESIGAVATQFEQSGSIYFSFTPYFAGASVIYYALQLERGTFNSETGEFEVSQSKRPVVINTFDATSDNFDSNPSLLRGTTKVFSWKIQDGEEWLGDYLISLRCWSASGFEIQTTKKLLCTVIRSGESLYPMQLQPYSLFARWGVEQETFPSNPLASEWQSNVDEYKKPGSTEILPSDQLLKVYDANGTLSGFLTSNNQNKLRIANEAYGIIDVKPFEFDPDKPEGISNWGKDGFTISVTFKTDSHPFTDRTVFFIGQYDADGNFSEGMYIGLETIIWKYHDGSILHTASCKIQQNTLTSVDFVLDRKGNEESGELKIFVNGVLNVAREVNATTSDGTGFRFITPSRMYLGCSCLDEGTQLMDHFADVEFYNISLFTYPLNDFQIVVNSMNSRARGSFLSNGKIDFSLYRKWREDNFMVDPDIANSMLWAGEMEINAGYKSPSYSEWIAKSHIPVMHIICNDSISEPFTKEKYTEINASTSTWYPESNFIYYDPTSDEEVRFSNTSIAIQGTSSAGYRSKNLEIKFIDPDTNEPVLFRPKESWLPESQFTLKADVVDSAHANNASIGKWINDNANKLFDNTPPMQVWDANKPVNCGIDGATRPFSDKMRIKHTLEGFPVILLMTFAGESQPEMLGIYSFNLGRAAYYNMGMKFLKNFTHDDIETELKVDTLPAFVTKYEEYTPQENFGNIKQSEIYSYEFGLNENVSTSGGETQYTALFMLDDESVLRHVGEFKFNGANNIDPASSNVASHVWTGLKKLFTVTANMTDHSIPKYTYDSVANGYIKTGDQYVGGDYSQLSSELDARLSVKNAYTYFMICVAFGLVDSLGKNMVLRSWNVQTTEGETLVKWWPCFYDMDTAAGLSNTGEEDVPKTAYIDKFENKQVEEGTNQLLIIKNSSQGGYDTYSSRLWDILRNDSYLSANASSGISYEQIWTNWRQDVSLIGMNATTGENGIKKFMTECFKSQTDGCGELLYNYDYRIKYLTKYKTKSLVNGNWVENPVATYGNVHFLHGTRVNYVDDWLSRRAIFFDGVFNYSGSGNILPYNNVGKFACGGGESYMRLTIKTNSPVIMRITQENDKNAYRYFVDENTETQIIAGAITATNSQVGINNLSEITMLDGLQEITFERFMEGFTLYGLSELDLSNNKTFSGGDSTPINFEEVFLRYIGVDETGKMIYSSDLRHLNLSNTAFRTTTETTTFPVVIDSYDKLKTVDISNGCVTSISLPKASLSDLKINNSAINSVLLINQAFLTEVNFTGCNQLTTVTVQDCAKLKKLDLSGLPNLTSISVVNCPLLTEINAVNCNKLITFEVTGAPQLTKIDLSGCSNTSLQITILTSPKLNELYLSNTKTSKPVRFTSGFNALSVLKLDSSNINALQFGNTSSIAKYNGEYVLDVSMFNLTDLDVTYNSMKYIKFKNSKSTPFKVDSSTFGGCTNLTRVFGHIDLTEGNCFYSPGVLSNFTVHGRDNGEVPVEGAWYGLNSDDDLDAWINTTDLQTNITISGTSLASMFQQTACNMFDVYDVLWRCTDKVTNLNSTFSQCKNCVTDINQPLRRDTFKKCSKVTNISYIFHSTNVGGPLYSPSHDGDTVTAYDGLFSYLPSLTTLNNAFQNGKKFYIDDLLFYNCASNTPLKITSFSSTFGWSISDNITIVSNTTGITADNLSNRTGAYARASKLLRYLPNLTSISDTFNNIWIHFDTETYEGVTYCPLLAHNKSLTSLTGFLLNIKVKNGSDLRYLFGGHEVFDDPSCGLFSRNIHTLNGVLYASSYDTNPAYFPVHNSMFKQIRTKLKYISHFGDTTTGNGVCTYADQFYSDNKKTPSFNGVGLNKQFLQEESEIFPLDIFTNCTNLIRVKYLFYGLTTNLPTSAEELFLPGDMFKNNKQLTHIDGCFANMSADIKYTLTGKGKYNGVEYTGFKNCKLTCVRYCFDERTVGKGNKVGGIPYGLFYQEKQTTRTFVGWTPEDYEKDGISIDTAYPTGSQPSTYTYKVIVNEPNNTITDMTSALRYFAGPQAAGYTAQEYELTSLETAGDFITVNPNYDPRKYIQSSTYDGNETYTDVNGEIQTNPNYNPYFVIENPNYDPCKYTWNIYYQDGTKNFGEIIENSVLYSKILDGSVTDVHLTIPTELYDYDTVSGTMSGDRSDSRNYICPPDLFRYCTNSISSNISVDYALAYSANHTAGTSSRLTTGIHGRIPAILFKPISNVKRLANVFNCCRNITPHLWGTDTSVGEMFPADLFKYNTALTNVSGIFLGIYIPSNVGIPGTLFLNNTNLNDASYLLYDSVVNYSGKLDSGMFLNNKYLNNVSYMFGANTSSPGTNNNIKQIESTLFDKTKNPNLNNVAGFLLYQGNTKGTVPEFWKWSISNNNRQNVFTGVTKTNIDNVGNIPAEWATGMI